MTHSVPTRRSYDLVVDAEAFKVVVASAAHDGVVAGIALQDVVVVVAGDVARAVAGQGHVLDAVEVGEVDAHGGVHGIRARTAVDHVAGFGDVEDVVARTAVPGVVAIGRASCRERVCKYVELSVVAGSLKK